MARTKDPVRHADLATVQVTEALKLVSAELQKTKDQLAELAAKRDSLQAREDTLSGALRALQA